MGALIAELVLPPKRAPARYVMAALAGLSWSRRRDRDAPARTADGRPALDGRASPLLRRSTSTSPSAASCRRDQA
jgi:hypothetical protein